MSSEIDTLKLELQPFVKRSVTTANGNVGGTTLVDVALVEANDYWNGMALLIRTGTYAGQIRRVLDFDAATDTITLDYTVGGQIATGIRYVMFFPTLLPASIVAPIPLPTDPVDRAARLLGIVYGNLAQLQQKAGTLELLVEDTGLNTNPERWLHENHWECNEVTINAAGVGGQQNLGGAVGVGLTRRIREVTIRHAGTNNTVVTLLIAGGAIKLTIDVPAQSTRVWSSQDGREFIAAEQPAVQTSDVTGGSTFVSAVGVEA